MSDDSATSYQQLLLKGKVIHLKRLLESSEKEITELKQAVKELDKSIEKFLYDASFVPPWESAGAKWVEIIQNLDRTRKRIMQEGKKK